MFGVKKIPIDFYKNSDSLVSVMNTTDFDLDKYISKAFSKVMTDYDIAQRYISKAQNAKANGLEFELPFTSFKNMMKAKRCQYTGIELTDTGRQNASDRSIDRIDSNKGYVVGNVVVICQAANQFKSLFENSQYPITPKMAKKILSVVEKIHQKS